MEFIDNLLLISHVNNLPGVVTGVNGGLSSVSFRLEIGEFIKELSIDLLFFSTDMFRTMLERLKMKRYHNPAA